MTRSSQPVSGVRLRPWSEIRLHSSLAVWVGHRDADGSEGADERPVLASEVRLPQVGHEP
jgi:hypothetical protein